MDVMEQTKKKMQGAIEHLKAELKTLRTGRANAAMVENVIVEAYDTRMRLKDMASISVPEARQIMINPFDVKTTHAIAKSIEAANLNLQPVVDGNIVRIKVPEMDASVRQEMVKLARKKCEETKVSIRGIRRDGNELIKKQKAAGDIPEDMMKKFEKNIQDLTDKSCKEADELTAEKEKEIVKV